MNEASKDNIFIGNEDFRSELDKLRSLRDFIISRSIKDKSKEAASIALGTLNSMRYQPSGREPTDTEWDDLNAKLQYKYNLLDEIALRKFNFTRAAPKLKKYPAWLVLASIVCLIVPTIVGNITEKIPPGVSFTAFLLWTVAVGALGSIAFILVNALGIQVDPTVDITDENSTLFRVLLGALFSLVLTLPFGHDSFKQLYQQVSGSDSADPKQAALLLMPFLFGFSTSLVLTVLNRLIEGVQTFFGVSAKKP